VSLSCESVVSLDLRSNAVEAGQLGLMNLWCSSEGLGEVNGDVMGAGVTGDA